MSEHKYFIKNVQTLLRAAEYIDRANEHGYAQSPSSTSSSSLSSSFSSSPVLSSSLPTYSETMDNSLLHHRQQQQPRQPRLQQQPRQPRQQQQVKEVNIKKSTRQRCNSSNQEVGKKARDHNIFQTIGSRNYSNNNLSNLSNGSSNNSSGYHSNQQLKSTRSKKRKNTKLRRTSVNRGSHNELEKNRRAHMRECLDELKKLVPLPSEHSRHTTLGLLMDTVTMVKKLRGEDERQQAELVFLKQKESNLINKIHNNHHNNNNNHHNNNNNHHNNNHHNNNNKVRVHQNIRNNNINMLNNNKLYPDSKFNCFNYKNKHLNNIFGNNFNNNNFHNNNNNNNFNNSNNNNFNNNNFNNNHILRYRSTANNSESSGSVSPLNQENDKIDVLGSASSSPIQSDLSMEENSCSGSSPVAITTIHQSFNRIL